MKRYLVGVVVLFLGVALATVGTLNAVLCIEGSMGWYATVLGTLGAVYGTVDIVAKRAEWSWWH